MPTAVAVPPAERDTTLAAERTPIARARRWLPVAGLTLLLALPLSVGLVAFRRPTWTPVLDLALTELRVRDVGTVHTPLIGLPGRIGTAAEPGSHPGPLSFYLLAPVYRALGSSAWALQVATVVLHVGATATALLVARRRAGTRLVVGVGFVLAVLMTGYGVGALSVPWNPYMPMLWWVVFLLAVWSVVCGDLPMLPVAVAAGSLCAQTHVPYLGMALGLGGAAAAAAAYHWWTARDAPGEQRVVLRWGLVALGVGVVLWLPPSIDQLTHDPGNYRLLVSHFASPPEETEGVSTGFELVLQRLDLGHLVSHQWAEPGTLVGVSLGRKASQARGAVFALAWLASAVGAAVMRHRPLVRLHAVVGAALLLAVYVVGRIFGTVWYYLMLWVWGIAALMALAIGWTVVAALARSIGPQRRSRAAAIGIAALLVLTAGWMIRLAADAPSARHADAHVSEVLAAIVPDAVQAIEDGVGPADGYEGRYLVTWADVLHIGSQGYGLLNELDRRGFDAGVPGGLGALATRHRVLDPAEATAQVVLATGSNVDRWRAVPGAIQVAFIEPRSPSELDEYRRLRAQVIGELRALSLGDLVPLLDSNLFGAAIDSRVPEQTQLRMGRLLDLGAPTAVFIAPPDATSP